MSQKQVVRRTSTNNRRKNTDGDRSDSGCFEDVDVLQMANRPCQATSSTPTKSTPAQGRERSENPDQDAGNDRSTGNDDITNEFPSNPDDCTEDAEFHAILERLAEVTKNPGDLYRLCFSSRLSFCGLALGGMEEQGSLPPPELTSRENSADDNSELVSDAVLADTTAQPAKIGVIIPETGDEAVEHRNCGDRQQCVEMLSLLSSFVEKAKEDPAVFSQSGLGRSLLGQLSSLLTTLEEAKKNPKFTSSMQPEHPNGSSHSSQEPPASGGNAESPISEQDSSYDSVKDPAVHLSGDSAVDATVSPPIFEDVTVSTSLAARDDEESPPPMSNRDGAHVSCADVDSAEKMSAEKSGDESGDVVTNGRRAVTPYSWDYGDIWEKELQRTQSTDSFTLGRFGEPGSNMPGDPLMPTFEEIRDELFYDAGFVLHEGKHRQVAKRRSRSADARSTEPFQSEPLWSGCEDIPASHSPFVRTVYQHGLSHDSRLTRSGSSLLPGGTSMTINLDRSYGRQVRVFPETPDAPRSGQLDDSSAFIVKEAVAGTSTFRGPKPWSMLKRRPSGLRRRSNSPASSEPSFSSEFQRTRLDSHGDSESSDSPNYVSAASSDCLTTDDSSSLTSSHYCGASSVQSSPTVSNRNSACFSDTGSSDLNDLRRVVYQDSSPELYPGDKYPRDKYPVGYGSSTRERFFSHDPVAQRMERREGSLDQRFGRMSRTSRAFSEPGDSRLNMVGKNHLRKSYQRAESYRGSDPSALRNLQHNAVRKWTRGRAVSPLIVRSDSDLNHLTRVQFIGDSYSRSNISKNLRYSREASRSPSPGPAHTRVLSCEILQNDKRDVYTKVHLSRSVHDEERAIDEGPNALLGRDGTRRSWHGHSPQRGFLRAPHASGNPVPRRIQSERYAYTAGLVDRRRQLFRPKKSELEDQAINATLVEVKNLRGNQMRSYHSAGNFRPSYDSDDSRHWSEFRAPAIGSSLRSEQSRQFPRNPLINRNRRAEVLSERSANTSFGKSRPRVRPDQPSAMTAQPSSSEKKEMLPTCQRQEGFQHAKTLSGAPEKTRAKDRYAHVRTGDGTKAISKEHVTHIVKETSFVGPSTFTRYQSPSNPPSLRTRRSKSFNEKDSPSQRRAQESEAYRRWALGTSIGDAGNNTSPDLPPASESDCGVVRRPDRRRRYSEGASRSSGSGDAPLKSHVVDESYCDPRRESIREGTYSIISAESARIGSKSEQSRLETSAVNEGEKSSNAMQDRVLSQKKKNNPDGCYLEGEREDGKKGEAVKHLLKNDVEFERKHVDHEDIEKMEVQNYKDQTVELNCTEKEGEKDGGTTSSHSKDQEGSPVWRAKEESEIVHGVNVFIDYRSKKPMSVQYEVMDPRPEDLSRMSKLGLSKKGKANMKQLSSAIPTTEAQIQKVCVAEYHQPALVGDVSQRSKVNLEEFPRKRLSRREKHVIDVSNVVQGYADELKPREDFKLLPVAASPVPYRRDKTIVYTDARSSVGSDTDSISHDSTISSSGSDVTVILNDDTDISADDFKQLAQNGSEIGIEIGSLEVDSSDDFPESSDSSPDKNSAGSAEWVARLPHSVRSHSYSEPSTTFSDLLSSSKDFRITGSLRRASKELGNKRSFDYVETGNKQGFISPAKDSGTNASIAYSPKEAGNNRSFAHPSEETGNDEKTVEPFKQGSKLRDIYLKYEQTVGETRGTADLKNSESPSSTSSQEYHKESGACSSESSKGKHSSGKNSEGGKGLFSRLKSIRKSFRGKKSEGKNVEKSGKSSKHWTKKAGKAPIPDIRTNLGSRSLPIFDSNSNKMCDGEYTVSKLTDRTQSTDFSTKGVSNEELAANNEFSRTAHEPWQPSGTLRNTVGVMSWSSDQLNSLRVRKPSKKAAKSLEVLLETCI